MSEKVDYGYKKMLIIILVAQLSVTVLAIALQQKVKVTDCGTAGMFKSFVSLDPI